MPKVHAELCKSDQGQTVRLPDVVAFPDSVREVEIVAMGRARLIVPAGASWDQWFDGAGVSDDFMAERQ